jgi:hypothetical protein
MTLSQIKQPLTRELKSKGLSLVWFPEPAEREPDTLALFGAEMDNSIGGFQTGNTDPQLVSKKLDEFVQTLHKFGIKKEDLHQAYPHVGRGKMWYTLIASIEWDKLDKVQLKAA